MWTTPRQITTATPPTEESCPLAELTPPTLSSTERPVCEEKEEIEERTTFDCVTLNHDEVMDPTSTERPVIGGSERGVHNIVFKVPGLSHAVVKQAEHLRDQELVQRIEDHPHRAALHADFQQNSTSTINSEKDSKEMIRRFG